MTNQRLWHFVGGEMGAFAVTHQVSICGDPIPTASHLSVSNGSPPHLKPGGFHLRGVVSNERYVTSDEKGALKAQQEPLGRAHARLGALIPIRKSAAWWDLSQGERRAIFEDRSAHIAIGQRTLPHVARRLHHCRDLDSSEPFDFLTWFDFDAPHARLFDDLLGALRATEEWKYVDRETEIRVERGER